MLKNIFLVLIAFLFFGCEHSKEEKIKIFVAWPGATFLPNYDWKLNEDEPTGVEPELIKKVLTTAGYAYEFVKDYKFKQEGDVRIDVLLDQKADVSIRSITITKEREEEVSFSMPYYYDGISAMVLDEEIQTKSDFKGKRVYAEKNTTALQWALENLKESKILNHDDFNSYTYPQDLLLEQKIDVFLADRTHLINLQSTDKNFILLDDKYSREPLGIAVRKENIELLNRLNEAILALKETGELEELTLGFEN